MATEQTKRSPIRIAGALASALIVLAAVAIVVLGVNGSAAQGEPAGDPFFGVVSQTPLTGEEVARMSEGRIGTLRFLVNWPSVDPTADPDDYDWSAIDAIVEGAAGSRIDLLPFIFGSPTWVAQDLDDHGCDPDVDCGLYAPRGPEALEAWRTFIADVTARYGPGGEFWAQNPGLEERPIRNWQIWNEQNSKSFYQPEPSVSGFADLVSAASTELREADPEAKVILGGMFGTPFQGEDPSIVAVDYLRELYEQPGFADKFDGVGVHPYAAHIGGVEEQVTLLHDEMVAAGDAEGEMWVTEIGWSSEEGDNPLQRGPEGQGELMGETLGYFMANRAEFNIANVTWFAWRDLAGEPICAWCAEAGLFEAESLTAKPSWDTLMAFTGGE